MKEFTITPLEKETIYTPENMVKALDYVESNIPGFEDLINHSLDDAISKFVDEMLTLIDVTLECMGMNDSQIKHIYDAASITEIICYFGGIGPDCMKRNVDRTINTIYENYNFAINTL